jgi:serine/threonine-protein kinase
MLGGRFVLGELIGSGGYGEVWRATDTVLSRPVAIKLLHQRYAQRAETLARFQAEAQHAAVLSHENIAQVYDYREPVGGQPPYLVMELVDGPSLEAVLAGRPLDARRTMDIIAQAAAGLQAAHAAGLIHRDVKPANLLLAPGGTVKITDFGISHAIGSAPVTVTGEVIGTPGYLAPERVMGEQAAPASDLYSLGMVAYECLTGAPPFTGPPLVVALAQRDRPLPPLPRAVSADVGAFVARLTAKDPAHRVRSAAADWFRRRTVLAYTCVACAAVIVIVLASVIGFASTPQPGHAPATAPPAAPAQNGGVAAPRPTSPAARPVGQPVMSPVADRQRVGGGRRDAAPGRPGHDTGHARGPGHGHGSPKGKGNGRDGRDGQGAGNDNGRPRSAQSRGES